jgi:hypothetical protein
MHTNYGFMFLLCCNICNVTLRKIGFSYLSKRKFGFSEFMKFDKFFLSIVLFLTSYICSQVYWLSIDYLLVAKSAVVSIEVSLLLIFVFSILLPQSNYFFTIYLTVSVTWILYFIDLRFIFYFYDVC